MLISFLTKDIKHNIQIYTLNIYDELILTRPPTPRTPQHISEGGGDVNIISAFLHTLVKTLMSQRRNNQCYMTSDSIVPFYF